MRLYAARAGGSGEMEPLMEMIRSIEQRTATDTSALPAERAPGGWGGGDLAEQEISPATPATVSSGWAEVARALVGGGLGHGAVHEWFATCRSQSASHASPIHFARPGRPVTPGNAPLCIFVHLARWALTGDLGWHGQAQLARVEKSRKRHGPTDLSMARRRRSANGWAVWIRRPCWPHPRVLVRRSNGDAQLLHHWLFVNPPDDAQRLCATVSRRASAA